MTRLLFILIACCCGHSFAQDFNSGGKLRPEQAIMDIRHYTVALNVDPGKKRIDGYCEISLVLSEATDNLLFDLVRVFNVNRVWVNGRPEKFVHDSDFLHVNTEKAIAAG